MKVICAVKKEISNFLDCFKQNIIEQFTAIYTGVKVMCAVRLNIKFQISPAVGQKSPYCRALKSSIELSLKAYLFLQLYDETIKKFPFYYYYIQHFWILFKSVLQL